MPSIGAAVLGSPERAPSVDECMQLLAKPGENAMINLLGLKLADRPGSSCRCLRAYAICGPRPVGRTG